MQGQFLTPGTLLDARYRIDAVLGQGGFGITYAAENVRIGLRVAIKELFWRGHSARSAVSPEVVLDQGDRDVFLAQKERFLREARIIRDFSGLSGVVHIQDYFEENETAYIVMEYVEGQTLAARIASAGKMGAEETFRLMLPLAEGLAQVHRGGVIHRDISPDNIMVQPDGSLKLIDFGAARSIAAEAVGHTAIAKESYAPGEQYDKRGKQGPWTDVYGLCATMYTCVCGVPPMSAVQRMFLDELEPPSRLGADVAPAFEQVILRGLAMEADRRHADMQTLCAAMREALPAPEKERPRRANVLSAAAAGVVCALLVIIAWAYHEYDEANRFRGIATERFTLTAPEGMTAAAFAEAKTQTEAALDDLAGADNYLLTVEGTALQAELPLSCFGGREIEATLAERFVPLIGGSGSSLFYELQANWENPEMSTIPGENQVLPQALTGKTAMLTYTWHEALTRGQRANLLMDFKVRLDALGVPYAFGTLYGDENVLALRIGTQRLNPFVLDSIGQSYRRMEIAGQHDDARVGFSYPGGAQWQAVYPRVLEDGRCAIAIRLPNTYTQRELQAVLDDMRARGEDTLYLQSPEGYLLAQMPLAQADAAGEMVFTDFCFADGRTVDEGERWVIDYVDALVNQTDLPASCAIDEIRVLDEAGEQLPGARIYDHYGAAMTGRASDAALRDCINRIEAEKGYAVTWLDSAVIINLNMTPGEDFAQDYAARLWEIVHDYGLENMVLNRTVHVRAATAGQSGELDAFVVWLSSAWDMEESRLAHRAELFYTEQNAFAPYAQAFKAAWQAQSGKAINDWWEM